jgi:hypothetical protein
MLPKEIFMKSYIVMILISLLLAISEVNISQKKLSVLHPKLIEFILSNMLYNIKIVVMEQIVLVLYV